MSHKELPSLTVRTTWSAKVLSHSLARSRSQLINGKGRSIYEPLKSSSYPFSDRYKSFLLHVCPPFPDSRASKRKDMLLKELSLSIASAHPTLSWSYCFQRCIDPKRIPFIRTTTDYRTSRPCNMKEFQYTLQYCFRAFAFPPVHVSIQSAYPKPLFYR